MGKAEGAIQRGIIQAGRALGYDVCRANAGRVKVRGGWLYLFPEGTPDVVMFGPGCCVLWIETKTPAGRLSAGQHKRHADLRALGHTVVVARSVDEFLAFIA